MPRVVEDTPFRFRETGVLDRSAIISIPLDNTVGSLTLQSDAQAGILTAMETEIWSAAARLN
jgi:hypothetical protein